MLHQKGKGGRRCNINSRNRKQKSKLNGRRRGPSTARIKFLPLEMTDGVVERPLQPKDKGGTTWILPRRRKLGSYTLLQQLAVG